MDQLGQEIYAFAETLFPIHRSITGDGVRETLSLIQDMLPELTIHEVPSGTDVFDWTVPPEWNIRDAYILDPGGKKIVDFQDSNLHVVGYSIPVDRTLSLTDLQKHLHSLPDQPDAIPYITSYYKKRWGFCLRHSLRERLPAGTYRAVIDSELKPGSLTYGELIIPGERKEEIFLSTYICHPSLANNEISGPSVTAFLARWIRSQPRKYTFRIIFIPETIGSITYLSRNLPDMKANIIAGFNVTCVGDNRTYSYLPSRAENTLADQVARHVLGHKHPDYQTYSYLDRGSDERQYCSPGVDLPVASVMRSKYRAYPEYHTSLDNMDLISPEGLAGAYDVLKTCLEYLEANEMYQTTVLCEPQLDKRGLYPTLSTRKSHQKVKDMMNLLAYADGERSLLEIAEKIQVPMGDLIPIVKQLEEKTLLKRLSPDEKALRG